ncbi:hypothetical protein CVT26_006674 [Gymnopilus dilepis]|uniref:F-box domain-containing protein n=1 Tax=Gymnopilus dilepis TaxID=231916 RepID=A0A409Y2V3_9AGAR|nr:hypothetical protein CVT26_006674 [Gymnopilus dilepis]
MDSPALPFVSLDAAEIRELHAILPVEYDVLYPSLEARGNSVQIGLKKQLGRNRRPACTLDLELLFALPLDVLIEILGQLHPIDLYNLMCTNTTLRNFLLDKRVSMAIWRYAFRHYPIILHFPPDVSPPQWATLLFGPATCDTLPIDDVSAKSAW